MSKATVTYIGPAFKVQHGNRALDTGDTIEVDPESAESLIQKPEFEITKTEVRKKKAEAVDEPTPFDEETI